VGEPSPSADPAPPSGPILPAGDWENPDSDPVLRASHESACRASDAVPAELWGSLVRVVEQQRSGWPFHLYWDGATTVVTCYALPDGDDRAGPAVVVPVTNAGGHRGPGVFAAFESTLLLTEYERWMGWGTTDPAVAALRVTPREGPGTNATVNAGFFLVQWPLGMDRRQPRLAATDGCGEPLVNGEPAPACAPA
jgi:hypothetical protein